LAEKDEKKTGAPKKEKTDTPKKKKNTGAGKTGKTGSSAKKPAVKSSAPKKPSTPKKPAAAKKKTVPKKTKKRVPAKKDTPGNSTNVYNPKTRKPPAPVQQDTSLSKKAKPSPPVKKPPEEDVEPEALERGDHPMSVVDHLSEMRSRLLVSLIVIVVCTVAGFYFSDYLMHIINQPFAQTGQKLNLFKIFEGVTLRIKAAVLCGLLLSLPLIVYQVWRYIFPAVEKGDRMFVRITLVAAVLLFYGGLVVTYIFIPMAITTLLGFSPEGMNITNNATEYLNFFVLLSLSMGIVFELPIIMLVLTKIGIISPSFLISKRKHAIVLIWIAAAFITPPDPLSMAILAIPLMLLYEISIFISKFIVIRKKKKELEEMGEIA